MAKKDTVRIKAEAYFIENIEATQKEIADLFKVTEKTIGNWAKVYDWEQKRLDFHASPTRIKQLLQQELLRIANGEKATLPADSISKLMATLERLDKKADPIVVMKILKDLDLFISQIDTQFAIECTKFHKQFLQHRIELEG
ncbi:hypothetical protein HXZ91_04895 [Myroides odoratimimus]|uniref:hypothetical protein n=1 Tax=Myroides odoratimimus TaxID=76832 RepID=UPI002578FD5B|nr:hypothetical protein [Myroides odoratimimus]MDM1033816.1 hypothetical protein [Myroides odoratimimus]